MNADACHDRPRAVFNFLRGQHAVARLPNRAAFDACDKSVATLLATPDAPTPYITPPLRAGAQPLFFICPVADHCVDDGQKVEVDVAARGGVAAAPGPAAFLAPSPSPSPVYGMGLDIPEE